MIQIRGFRDLVVRAALVGVAFLAGCKGGSHSKPAALDEQDPNAGSSIDGCAKHNKGCPCTEEGQVSSCGSLKEKVGDYVICTKGVRTCSDSEWGDCVAQMEEKKPLSFSAPMQGGFSFQGLGSSASCDNLCDPECIVLEDTPSGLIVPTDLFADAAGLTLPAGGGGGTCEDVTISPSSDTVTITAIATDGTITASPNNADFDAFCSGGVEMEPSWTIDAYDRAVIDSNGKVTVYSGVAGPITVTGSSSTNDATAELKVKVKIEDRGSSTSTATAFDAAGSGADSARTLYPYKNTVFPLDLQAPMVQWQRGDTSATAVTATDVQVALRFPKGCTGPTAAVPTTNCTFWYSKIYNGTEPVCTSGSALAPCLNTGVPAWQIPQQIWSAFDRTAAGDSTGAEIVIQRRYSSSVKNEMTIPVKFATDSLKGTVYYTQYKRYMKSTSCNSTSGGTPITSAAYVPGTICPVGPCTQDLSGAGSATTRAIDLSSSASVNEDPFNGTAGCPVCHSVSANGSRHVSVGQSQQTFGGGTSKGVNNIASLMGDTTFTAIGTAPNYGIGSSATEPNGEQSYGFAYGALFPDGSRVLQGSNYWGNTEDIPSGGNNTQNATENGVAGFPKPYFVVDTDQPGAGVQFATTAALPSASFASGVLTASAVGTLTIDGVSMGTVGYSILVKDESAALRNGVYAVTTAGTSLVKWKLTRRSDMDSAGELALGTEVRVSDGNANRGKVFYVSAPSMGAITVNTTALTFSQRPMPAISFSASPLSASYATTAALTPATVTLSGNVLTGGSPATLTIDGHNMALMETVLVKDQATTAQNGVYKMTTLPATGIGTVLAGDYATAAALPANTRTSNTLTGNSTGALIVDGVTLALNDDVLVKDEATAAHNGLYTLSTLGTGLGTALSAQYATTAALPTHSLSGITLSGYGPVSIDGTTLTSDSSVLVKNETTTSKHGIYTLTNVGNGGTTALPTVKYASTANLPAAFTATGVLQSSSYGSLSIDGSTVTVSDAVLLKDQTDQKQNGVFTLTTVGTGGSTSLPTVKYASTANLPASFTATGVLQSTSYGSLSMDGSAVGSGEAVLLKDQTDQKQNGVYTLTTPATGGSTALPSVKYASTANLTAAFTSTGVLQATNVGTLSIDGSLLLSGDAVLLKDQTDQKQNGVYTLTTVGNGGSTTLPTVKYATTANVPGAFTATGVLGLSTAGPLSVDGSTLVSADAVLLKNQTDQKQNGVYTLTTVPNGGTTTMPSVKYASTVNLGGAFTATGVFQSSTLGPLTIDGFTVASTEAVLLKNQTDQKQNGIYTLTTVPTGGSTVQPNVKYASTANVAAAFTSTGVLQASSGGTLTIDGGLVASGEAVLLKNQTDQKQNGIYTLTTVPTGGGTVQPDVKYASTANLAGAFTSTGVFQATNAGLLVPDGTTLASGEAVLLKDQTDQKQNGIYTLTTIPNGGTTNLPTVAYASTLNLAAAFTSTGVLRASANGALVLDGGTISTAGTAVLLKNQTDQKQNGVYTLTTVGNATTRWILTRRVDSPALAANVHVPVTSGSTNGGKSFYVSSAGAITYDTTSIAFTQSTKWVLTRRVDSPALAANAQVNVTAGAANVGKAFYVSSTGSITYDTTNIAFTQSTKWVLTRRADSPALAPNAQVPVTNGTTNAGLNFYVSTPSSGSITYDTTNIAFTQSAKWVLTRRSDSPALAGGFHVPVTNGSTNASKTFYVSTPASGAITYDSTAIAFTQSTFGVLTRRADSPALAPDFQVPVSSGSTNASKTFYVSTPSSGSITYDSTAIAFTQSAKWVLTRRVDSPALAGASQVPVTNGSTNAGKTYYVSLPASGAITYDTTSIAFVQSARWVLTRRPDSPALAPTFQVPVSNGTANAGKAFYVSTPASGSITYDSTAIAFTQGSKWVLTRRVDSPALAPTFHVPVSNGTANAGKAFYVSTPASGSITYDTSNIAFTQTVKWVLTRRSDNDVTGDITPGQQVSITNGSTNANKTFYVSLPASGTITINTDGITYAAATAWKLTRHTSADSAPTEVFPGLQVSASGGATNAGKTYFISDPASGTITVNTTPLVFSISTSWKLTRVSQADETGEIIPGLEVKVANGTANAGKVYFVSSPTSGTITVNTTGIAFSETALPSMMVPTFSPDGTKVAYINGDADVAGGLPATGWRRGLSMFSFAWNDATQTFTLSNKKRLVNTYAASPDGMVVKWPFFESDSRSLVYVESATDDFCSSTDINSDLSTNARRACHQKPYAASLGARGNMTPTARGGWPGKVYSIDTGASTPSSTRVELSKLNDADDDGGTDDAVDGDKAYQPTVLPFAAGDKRWVIFTSTRAYGNQVNPKSFASSSYGNATHFTCSAPMLWMSALTNSTANGTDRSNPAFFLPGQKTALPTASNDYINERGYLVPSPCKVDGISCTTDDECCGADDDEPSAACRAPAGWTPADGAPAKKCEELSGTCNNAGASCTVNSDCCNRAQCLNFECAEPGDYESASFTREYAADCPVGYHPDWELYRFHLTTEGDSYLQFWAQTAKDLDDLDSATLVDLGSSTATIISPASPAYVDVGVKLDAAKISRHYSHMRIIVDFEPSSDKQAAPILHDWEMRYTCAPAE